MIRINMILQTELRHANFENAKYLEISCPHQICKSYNQILDQSIFLTALPEDLLVEALLDGSAKMPCDVLQKKDDTVEFVFWYKNDGVTALYTLDAREGRHLQDAVHMKNETYADRVNFYVEGAEPYLQMDKLREEDTGDYFCRVDYQWSATEIRKVELIVVGKMTN